MIVRPYSPEDYPEWLRMRSVLWSDQTEADMAAWSERPDAAVFVAERTPGRLCGFAEVGARPYEISHRAHERLGFCEVERVVLYRKDL